MEQTRVINWNAINELAEEVFEQICDIFKIDTVCTYPDELKKKSLAYYLFPEYINEIAKTNLTNEEIIYEELTNLFMDKMSNIMTANSEILNITSRLLRVLSIYIISKFQTWMNKGYGLTLKECQYNSDERVMVMLKDLYHHHDLNEDIMQFIILNTQIALAKNSSIFGEGSTRRRGIGIESKLAIKGNSLDRRQYVNQGYVLGYNLVDCMSKARIYSKLMVLNDGGGATSGARFIEKENPEELIVNLKTLLNAISFFEKISLTYSNNDDKGIVEFVHGHSKYVTNGILKIKTDTNALLYLKGIRYNKENNYLILIYNTINEDQKVTYYVKEKGSKTDFSTKKTSGGIIEVDSVENYYLALTGHILQHRNNDNGLAGLISYNYKYINKLALAIVDSIEDEEYERCHGNLISLMKENSDVFVEELHKGKMNDGIIGNEEYELLNWDLALIKLLTYESPSRVLKVLFKDATSNDIKIINNIIINLKLRLPNSFDIEKTISLREEIKNRIMSQLPIFNEEGRSLVDSRYLHTWEDKITVDASINALVTVLAQNSEDNRQTLTKENIYSNSIYDKISILENLHPLSPADNDAAKRVCDEMLQDAIKKYLCFYEGIYYCATTRLKYENETFNNCLTDLKLKQFQDEIEKKFIEGVYEKAKQLKSLSTPSQYLLEIKELHQRCLKENNVDDYTDFGKSIRVILGHLPIIYDRFTDLVEFHPDGRVSFRVVDNHKQYPLYLDDKENIHDYINSVRKLLLFLSGNADKLVSTPSIDRFRNMIYPATATFSGNRVNREQMALLQFTLILDDNIVNVTSNYDDNRPLRKINEVSISTEFTYQINEQFYCLPNVSRITDYLWADPILISCDKFNREIRRANEE